MPIWRSDATETLLPAQRFNHADCLPVPAIRYGGVTGLVADGGPTVNERPERRRLLRPSYAKAAKTKVLRGTDRRASFALTEGRVNDGNTNV